MLQRIAPQWIVEDVPTSVAFYRDKLGFAVEFLGDPPLFAILRKDGITLMVRALPAAGMPRPNFVAFQRAGWHTDGAEAWDAYVWVENIDSFYEALRQKDIDFVKALTQTDHGTREFEIRDPDGYNLCFGQLIL